MRHCRKQCQMLCRLHPRPAASQGSGPPAEPPAKAKVDKRTHLALGLVIMQPLALARTSSAIKDLGKLEHDLLILLEQRHAKAPFLAETSQLSE